MPQACPCNRASQCLGGCTGPLAVGPLPGACADVVLGRCEAETSRAGCHCVFDQKGRAAPLGAD